MNLLGDYLRARRDLVRPEDVGIPATGQRRVPGLRREEVAMLAGISTDYYLRLEQGRDRSPSMQVLDALARVLLLDEPSRGYLAGLAGPRSRPAPRTRAEKVPPGILQLLDTVGVPALVESRYFDVLATNAHALAVSPRLVPGSNRIRSIFLDEEERAIHPDLDRSAAGMVAGFRQSVGAAIDDPRCVQLVGELSLGSEQFRRLWARHDVKVPEGANVRLLHPEVGEIHLRKEKLVIPGTDGQLFVMYHAEPGSDSARSLALLGSLAATRSPQ
ncbi:MAG TPA: helix-turn-helix transcriptional regulator [Marmoricola sp.]|jgi:transcriptional regulator with XRE-family HTH domain|nr:helix-turn-helix transcriptional regulator [Marmoricola sp.]